ncbi:MAG: lytic transglycosylase [Burkholderiales bacterium PBB1]|nr:MAG: lytic transglycosylase [Burkholderiales bacterium PBB1]
MATEGCTARDVSRGHRRLRALPFALGLGLSVGTLLGSIPHAHAATPPITQPTANVASEPLLDARDAFRKRDRGRLAALRDATAATQHPLAMWVAYWDANARLSELQQADLEAFYSRWTGTYVEDRLRNDWLLELGRRRDWANFVIDFPRFKLNDDREVSCYALLTDHLAGQDVRDAARNAWAAQRDADDGCALLARTLLSAGVFKPADAWRKARLAMDINRPRAVVQAVAIARGTTDPKADKAVQALIDAPASFLSRKARTAGRANAELATLALARLAALDPDAAADALAKRWERALPADLAAWAWAATAKQSAQRLSSDAPDQFQRAERLARNDDSDNRWPDDTYAWKVRAALRANQGAGRWQQVIQGINAMSPAEQRDPAWVYWKARGLQVLAADSQDGEALQAQAREMLLSVAGQWHFYGTLSSERLGMPVSLPPRPPAMTAAERDAAARDPGLNRALQLIAIGLRSEGVREWNFSLRTLSDRELLAAAQLACDREIWDRCINTSERTRSVVDMQQRFPTPFREQVLARTQAIGLDPAYVYGLIRQESRFVTDARSGVGASGLMQVMPATARWTARKIGLDYSHDRITDRDINLTLGTGYLKLVLDDFAGSQPLAAAAYNAGPSRSRRWREGPMLDPATWAENIPFSETRDYVKKVLSNAAYYAALLGNESVSLSARLGASIGPRDPAIASADRELP